MTHNGKLAERYTRNPEDYESNSEVYSSKGQRAYKKVRPAGGMDMKDSSDQTTNG
jgi:hypothetical protein